MAIIVGGALGGGLRTGMVSLTGEQAGHWSWTIFTINVVGCFLLGYFVTRLQERLPITAYMRPLLGTGFCGALTTFSTVQLQLLQMLDRGAIALAFAYGGASVAAGFTGVLFGTAVVRRARLTW